MHTLVYGIDCYGKAEPGANYEVKFEDEFRDFITTDIEASSWTQVVNALSKSIGVRTSGRAPIKAMRGIPVRDA